MAVRASVRWMTRPGTTSNSSFPPSTHPQTTLAGGFKKYTSDRISSTSPLLLAHTHTRGGVVSEPGTNRPVARA